MELYQQDGLLQAELCKRIGIEQPTSVRTLDRMERDGFVKREKSPSDRRAFQIRLTDKGRCYEAYILNSAEKLNLLALEGFTLEERLAFEQFIQRLNANLLK